MVLVPVILPPIARREDVDGCDSAAETWERGSAVCVLPVPAVEGAKGCRRGDLPCSDGGVRVGIEEGETPSEALDPTERRVNVDSPPRMPRLRDAAESLG